MSSSSTLALAELRDGPLYRFADWPNPEVSNGRIGVYTVWGGDELIYVGMGGRAVGPNAEEIQREGLASRPPLLNPLPRSSKANSSRLLPILLPSRWTTPAPG
jgi:hypothetical protein